MDPTKRPLRRGDIETHQMPDGSCLLFDPVTCEGYVLEALGALVWDYADGALTGAQIIEDALTMAPADPTLADAVMGYLDQFTEKGLLSEPAGATI